MKNLPELISLLKNSSISQLKILKIKYYKPWIKVLNLLYKEGYIQNFYIEKNKQRIYISLRYFGSEAAIKNLNNFVKISRPLYLKKKDIWKFSKNNGLLVITTKDGVFTHEDCLKRRLGGKLLFSIS